MYRKVCIELLQELFDALPKKDRDILGKFYGVFGFEKTSLKEIGMYHMMEESGVEKVDEERLRGEHDAFMVTTRDIDQQVRDLSKVVGYGINWALQDLEIEEMNALLS